MTFRKSNNRTIYRDLRVVAPNNFLNGQKCLQMKFKIVTQKSCCSDIKENLILNSNDHAMRTFSSSHAKLNSY